MQHLTVRAALFAVVSAVLLAQSPATHIDKTDTDTPRNEVRLPNGKLQIDEMLKADREESLKDARRLIEVGQELEKDLDQQSAAQILSIADVHRTEEIERLAKRIRARLRRY